MYSRERVAALLAEAKQLESLSKEAFKAAYANSNGDAELYANGIDGWSWRGASYGLRESCISYARGEMSVCGVGLTQEAAMKDAIAKIRLVEAGL